jgi:hypothetical protein
MLLGWRGLHFLKFRGLVLPGDFQKLRHRFSQHSFGQRAHLSMNYFTTSDKQHGRNSLNAVLTLATSTLPEYSLASLSRIGATILHGPHQGAQKSTITGVVDFKTVCSKAASVTCTGVSNMVLTFLLVRLPHRVPEIILIKVSVIA